ncbi:MAG TPA: aminotransferase class I/II-fold pyridoxal phosphate-dependent enzyme [Ardenticatenaceae bacterium]|nr:aminotransferase class I/II-fold pyridoxal phosphate-dependent enzyme [Ardenticatenaceae bacterium]
MKSATTETTVGYGASSRPGLRLPRSIALLGGTSTLGDALLALRYLVSPRELVRGPAIAAYERAFAAQVQLRHAFSFSSGRVGLYGLLQALGIGPGDEVLLQVPTHIVVPNAIRYVGARPVYVDCTLDNYNMDLDQAERRITPRTKALLLQHTFGIPADLDAALDLARRHGLELIEDCVHALGSTYRGRPVGTYGRAAFFSTEETKTISCTMGGMVATGDDELAARMQAFQAGCAWPSARLTASYLLKFIVYYGLTEPHVHPAIRALYDRSGGRHPLPKATSREEFHGARPPSYEQRLSNAQAALALRQLGSLQENLAHRRAVSRAYDQRLAPAGLALRPPPPGADPALLRYPVWVEDRESVRRKVAPYAILGTWFTSVLEEAAAPEHGGYEPGSCPRAEAAARHLVNLPTHPRVTDQDIERISAALVQAAEAPGR